MRATPEPSLNPDDYIFAHQIRVRFSETDAMGIVHHSRYLPYLEETRVEYLRSIGQSYADSRGIGEVGLLHNCGSWDCCNDF